MGASMDHTEASDHSLLTRIAAAWKHQVDQICGPAKENDDASPRSDAHIWQAFAAAYVQQECLQWKQRRIISSVELYPQIVRTLAEAIESLTDGLGSARSEDADRIRCEITIFSTLLPRHYYNLPHQRARGRNSVVVNYHEDFQGAYRDVIEGILRSKQFQKRATLRRCTVVAQDKATVQAIARQADFGSPYFGKNLFTLEELLQDDAYVLGGERPTTILSLFGDLRRDRELFEYICGPVWREFESENGPLYKALRHKAVYRLAPRTNFSEPSILDRFLDNLHSDGCAFLLVIGHGTRKWPASDVLGKFTSENHHQACSFGELEHIFPDFAVFSFMDGDSPVSEIVLTADIDPRHDVVALRVQTAAEAALYKRAVEELVPRRSIRLVRRGQVDHVLQPGSTEIVARLLAVARTLHRTLSSTAAADSDRARVFALWQHMDLIGKGHLSIKAEMLENALRELEVMCRGSVQREDIEDFGRRYSLIQ
jgi:hypothetical protein